MLNYYTTAVDVGIYDHPFILLTRKIKSASIGIGIYK